MGKTYRNTDLLKQGVPYRHPRGRRAAIRNGARSVPPDSWDDIPLGREALAPTKAAKRMARRGFGEEEIAHRLSSRFNMPYEAAVDVARTQIRWVVRRGKRETG